MSDTPHHITRIDIEPSEKYPRRHPTHGWQVRVRRDGKRLSKFFADARFDGKEGALEAAILYRDELLSELPPPDSRPRKAWSNTGVVGLSVREKQERSGASGKMYVQLNWVDAEGRRRGASYSVEKWGLRRALWNGCLRLYKERDAAGRPVEEPHVMFARAQEPFEAEIEREIAAEEQAAQDAPSGADTTSGTEEPATVGSTPRTVHTPSRSTRTSLDRDLTADEAIKLEESALEHIASALFGKG